MEITITEFKEQYLSELREQFQLAVQKSILENRLTIAQKLEKQIETFLRFVGTFQKTVPIEVGEMQIALLYSSVCMGEPRICISAYGKDKLLGEEILNIKYRCDWLFTEWDAFQESIEAKIKEIHGENCIRKSAVKMMMNESISFLIYCLYAATKYQFMELDRMDGYNDLILSENFRLSVGGYRDWSRTLYRTRPEIDIFMQESDTSLNFCVFRGAVYNKKKFSQMELSHARFYECEFVHCEFDNIMMQDCIFDHCRIYHCSFERIVFCGATFRQCTLKKNQTKHVQWDYQLEDEPIDDLYKEVEFLECESDGTILEREGV